VVEAEEEPDPEQEEVVVEAHLVLRALLMLAWAEQVVERWVHRRWAWVVVAEVLMGSMSQVRARLAAQVPVAEQSLDWRC
jgi:hypothetical protein